MMEGMSVVVRSIVADGLMWLLLLLLVIVVRQVILCSPSHCSCCRLVLEEQVLLLMYLHLSGRGAVCTDWEWLWAGKLAAGGWSRCDDDTQPLLSHMFVQLLCQPRHQLLCLRFLVTLGLEGSECACMILSLTFERRGSIISHCLQLQIAGLKLKQVIHLGLVTQSDPSKSQSCTYAQ